VRALLTLPETLVRRLAGRLRDFHGDRSGQIMPLVFFLGIAFFAGVGLVLNTGKTVNRRIQSQDAVDAATVSGANALARGMNFIARNNVTNAKILASIVIIRSFEPAAKASQAILKGWQIASEIMIRVGDVLEKIPFPPGISQAGTVLKIAGGFIKAKVKQEIKTLNALLKIVKPIAKKWDNEIKTGRDMGLGKGFGWKAVKGLSLFGDVLGYGTPILAQMTTKTVYVANLGEKSESVDTPLGKVKVPDCWLLPVYARLPACKGPASSFAKKVTPYVATITSYMDIPGWLLLTLAMYPLTYRGAVIFEMAKIFLTVDAGVGTGISPPDVPDDVDAARMKVLADEVEAREKEIKEKSARYDALENSLIPAKQAEVDAASAAVDKAVADHGTTSKEAGAARDVLKTKKDELKKLKDERDTVKSRIEQLQAEIEERNAEMEEIAKRRQEQGGPGAGVQVGGGLGDPVPGVGQKFFKRTFHPWLVLGDEWPKSFTYWGLGYRALADRFLPGVYPAATPPLPSPIAGLPLADKAFTYAAARVYSRNRADLWTADWSAKLVRAELSLAPLNPFGRPPSACRAAPPYLNLDAHLSLGFEIDIFGWIWEIPWPFEWPNWTFDIEWGLTLPNGPGALGKH